MSDTYVDTFKWLDREGVSSHFLKQIECCNFQTITVIYKVYIFGMAMCHRIQF